MMITLQHIAEVFEPLVMPFRSQMRNLESLVTTLRALARRVQLPSKKLRLLWTTCRFSEGCLSPAAVCLGLALLALHGLDSFLTIFAALDMRALALPIGDLDVSNRVVTAS